MLFRHLSHELLVEYPRYDCIIVILHACEFPAMHFLRPDIKTLKINFSNGAFSICTIPIPAEGSREYQWVVHGIVRLKDDLEG